MKDSIDWNRVRAARATLARLARANPELRGPATTEDWRMTLEIDAMTTQQTAFRLPTELIERLDRYADQLNREQPGTSHSRADVVRILLTRGLDAVDKPRRSKR